MSDQINNQSLATIQDEGTSSKDNTSESLERNASAYCKIVEPGDQKETFDRKDKIKQLGRDILVIHSLSWIPIIMKFLVAANL